MFTDEELCTHLEALENELLTASSRSSRRALERLLSPAFVEYGSSGRVYDREQVMSALAGEAAPLRHVIEDFELVRLASDAALVTYHLESFSEAGDPFRETLRSSTWMLEGDDWRLRFHQGTIGEDDHPNR